MAFTTVGVAASRHLNKVNQLARMERNRRGNTPPKLTNGVIPTYKTKGPIINALVPLIRQVTNDIDLQYFLISLYDDTSNDQYTVDLFSGQTHEQARDIIQAHVTMFSDTFYRGSAPKLSFDLRNDENVVNLAYIMYLDMRHDETINKSLSFDDFCKAEINVKVKQKNAKNLVNRRLKSPVFILFGKGITPKETDFIKRIRGFGGEGDNAELAIKNNLPSIHLKPGGASYLPIYKQINRDQIKSNILKDGHNLFMGIDQEDEKATVTLNISRTKYNFINSNGKPRSAKIFYPLVSIANLMDPGKNMLIESAKENTKYSVQAKGTLPLSRLTWNYKQPEFKFVMSHGTTVLSTSYRDEVKTGNGNKKRGYEYTINNANTNDAKRILSSTMSKGKAKVGTTNDRVAKFMGDFMQALTMIAHIKHNTVAKYNYCLATGDAMLCNSFIFMCSIANVSPNLWMPISRQQTSIVYGNMLNNFNPNSNIKSAPTEVRNANNVRRTPNRSNGRSRNRLTPVAEGSGNSANSATSRKNRPGATRIQVVNVNNNNMNNANRAIAGMFSKYEPRPQAQKRKRNNANNKNNNRPPTRGPNAQSGVGSRNSIVGNKNNNLNSAASPMNINGQKSKPNNRNAMIRNLRAQLARAQAALVESTQAANAAANAAKNATKKLQQTRNARNAQAAKNAAAKNAAAKKAANEDNAKAKKLARALKQLQTSATLAGAQQNQGPRRSTRRKF